MVFLSGTIIQLFLIIHECFSNNDNVNLGWEDAEEVLRRYKSAFDCPSPGEIDTFFHTDFSLKLCRKNERPYEKRDMARGLYTAYYCNIRFHEMKIVDARWVNQTHLEFTANPVVKGDNRGVIHFEAEKNINGKYELKKQVETDCHENVYTSAMINYEKTAEQIAKHLMARYVDAISQRSLPNLYNLFSDRESYRLQYCDGPNSYSEIIYTGSDLRMPSYNKSKTHQEFYTTIVDPKLKMKDGSISFQAFGGAFHNYFVATKHFYKDLNRMSFLLEFDKDLGCRYDTTKQLDFEELQYSYFF